ncbi:transglycosylase associated family protein [Burkholderia pseudomallei]|nr:transglycosylase associated family protein [Burkholderia pseudomallei]
MLVTVPTFRIANGRPRVAAPHARRSSCRKRIIRALCLRFYFNTHIEIRSTKNIWSIRVGCVTLLNDPDPPIAVNCVCDAPGSACDPSRHRQRPTSVHSWELTKERTTMAHGLIMWLIIGAIAGWLAGLLVKGGGFGLLVDIIVGIVGAVIGGWLAGILGIHIGGGFISSVIVAVIGAVILLFVIRLFKRA